MIRGCSHLIKYKIIGLAIICLAVTVLWPGWRADLRACDGDNGYGYDDGNPPNDDPTQSTQPTQGAVTVEIQVNPCATPPIEGLEGGPYVGITVAGSDQFSINTVDTGSFLFTIEDADGNESGLGIIPPSAWTLEEASEEDSVSSLSLYFDLSQVNGLESLPDNGTLTLTGETLLGEAFNGTAPFTAADFADCEAQPGDEQPQPGDEQPE